MKRFSLNGLKMTLIVYSVESERGRKSENETKVNEVNVSSFRFSATTFVVYDKDTNSHDPMQLVCFVCALTPARSPPKFD